MSYFLVELNYIRSREVDALRPSHQDYIEQLFERGNVASAGRFSDNSGSVFLYKADNEHSLQSLVGADPYLINKVADIRSVRQFEPGIAVAIRYVRPT